MYLLSKHGTYPAKDQHVTTTRLPLRPVSYLEHTNEHWIRYHSNDTRNVLVNIYDAQSAVCVAKHASMSGIASRDAKGSALTQ